MMFDLTGKIALVTGAARGIGRALAAGLARHGADVAVLDRVPARDAADALRDVESAGRRAWYFRQDLSKTARLQAAADRVWQKLGRIDVLVNNAGVAYLEHFNQITLAHWRHVMSVNLDAVFFLTRAVAEQMIAAGVDGRVINVSSNNGLVAEAGLAHYNASKGAVELLTQSLAIELGAHGITVNSIAPGVIPTTLGGELPIDMKRFAPYVKEHVPLRHRTGTPEDLAGAAVFLASRAGAYMTGQHLVIDGGILCQQMPRLQFMRPYANTVARRDRRPRKASTRQ